MPAWVMHQAAVQRARGHNVPMFLRVLSQAAEVLSNMDDRDLNIGIPVPAPLRGTGDYAFLEKDLKIAAMTA